VEDWSAVEAADEDTRRFLFFFLTPKCGKTKQDRPAAPEGLLLLSAKVAGARLLVMGVKPLPPLAEAGNPPDISFWWGCG
jgi:hypothetical protein